MFIEWSFSMAPKISFTPLTIFAYVSLYLLFFLALETSYSMSCMPSTCRQQLERADLVFKGVATETFKTTPAMQEEYAKKKKPYAPQKDSLPDLYTVFEVRSLYKGAATSKINIYYSSQTRPYEVGTEKIIYAKNKNGFNTLDWSCGSGCTTGKDQSLDFYALHAQHQALDALIKNSPNTRDLYYKKAELYEDFSDYIGAAYTYERLVNTVASESTSTETLLRLGRNLYLADKPEEALKVLTPLKSNSEAAIPYIQLSLIQLDRGKELDGQRLMLAGQKIRVDALNGLNVSNSDFTNAHLAGKLEDATLDNSQFAGAELRVELINVQARNVNLAQTKLQVRGKNIDLSGSTFENAKVDFRLIENANIQNTNFSGASLQLSDYKGVDFSAAKFTDAKIHSIGNANTSGADFTGADFFGMDMPGSPGGNNRLDLSGQKLDGSSFRDNHLQGASFKGASLKNADFTGANLIGTDFTNADLTNANFVPLTRSESTNVSGADFSSAKVDGVDWRGAVYDCKTKFPSSFNIAAAGMDTADLACLPPTVSKPILACITAPDASCIYSYLTKLSLGMNPGSQTSGRIKRFYEISESLLSGGENELASYFALRGLAETAEVYTYPRGDFIQGLALLEKATVVKGQTLKVPKEKVSIDAIKSNNSAELNAALDRKKTLESTDPQKRVGISSFHLARWAFDYLDTLENLSELYIKNGQIEEALKTAKLINKETIMLQHKKSYDIAVASRVAHGYDCGVTQYKFEDTAALSDFNIDDTRPILAILMAGTHGDGYPGDKLDAFLNILFELSLHKTSTGDTEYARKALALVNEIMRERPRVQGMSCNLYRSERRRNYHLAALNALSGNHAEVERFLLPQNNRIEEETLAAVIRAYLTASNTKQALEIARKIKSSSNKIAAYRMILEKEFSQKQNDKVLSVLKEMEVQSNLYPPHDLAEVKVTGAKFYYELGNKDKARQLAREAAIHLQERDGRGSYRRRGAFDVAMEVALLTAEIEQGNIENTTVIDKEDPTRMVTALAKHGYIKQAADLEYFSPDYCIKKTAAEEAEWRARADTEEKRSQLARTIDRQLEYVTKECQTFVSKAAAGIIFHIARLGKKEDFSPSYERLLAIANAADLKEDKNRLLISDFLIDRETLPKLDAKRLISLVRLITFQRLPSENNLRSLILSLKEAGLNAEVLEVWRYYMEDISVQRGYAKPEKILEMAAKDFIDAGEFDEAEKALLYTIDSAGFVLNFGYKKNFTERIDKIHSQVASNYTETKNIKSAASLIQKIATPVFQANARFNWAVEFLKDGKLAEARGVITPIKDTRQDAYELIRLIAAAAHHEKPPEQFASATQDYKNRLDVYTRLSDVANAKIYQDILAETLEATESPELKSRILLNTSDNTPDVQDRGATVESLESSLTALKKDINAYSGEEIKNIALQYYKLGNKDRALEILKNQLDYASKYRDNDYAIILPLADAYLTILGPIEAATAEKIMHDVRYMPHSHLKDTVNRDNIPQDKDYFSAGMEVSKILKQQQQNSKP